MSDKPWIGVSEAHRRLLGLIERVARNDVELLFSGETGVGKEHYGRYAHQASPRRDGPFVPVNCGSIPPDLFENELFGHVGGAFTGARARASGLVEAAADATIPTRECEMPGLLVNGKQQAVPDLNIINAHDVEWCRLDPKDFRPRPTSWVRQIILHTTKGDWPQRVLSGHGPGGRAKLVADMWRGDPTSSAAHLVIDNDGTVACLCDLATVETYHATVSNPWSIGIEMYQEGCDDGHYGVHEAVYAAAEKLVPALCRMFGIQFQIPKLPYKNEPLRRLIDGGESCVGVFGHRDNTGQRGYGDPGDEIFARLAAAGAERFDHNAGEDLDVWKGRQRALNDGGATLTIDGVPGPSTIEALRAAGHPDGIWALGGRPGA